VNSGRLVLCIVQFSSQRATPSTSHNPKGPHGTCYTDSFTFLTFIAVFCFVWAWCVILFDVCICGLCVIVVPLPPGNAPFAVQTNNNKNKIPTHCSVNYRNPTLNTLSWPGHALVPGDFKPSDGSVSAALQDHIRLKAASKLLGPTAASARTGSEDSTRQLHSLVWDEKRYVLDGIKNITSCIRIIFRGSTENWGLSCLYSLGLWFI
jgi:hypothetical protein